MSTKLNCIILLLILNVISNACSASTKMEYNGSEEPSIAQEHSEVSSVDLDAYRKLLAHKFTILTNYLKSSQDLAKLYAKRGHIWKREAIVDV